MTTHTHGADVRAIARWSDESGSTYTWPQGHADNRRARVLARIRRFGIPCDPATLTIEPVRPRPESDAR